MAIGRDRYVERDLKRYLLYTEGSTDGHVALNSRLVIYPKKSILIEEKFPAKIRGIAVGARSEDEMGYAFIERGGVGQNFVDFTVSAGSYSTEALVTITTH